jgi:hypothetical protein
LLVKILIIEITDDIAMLAILAGMGLKDKELEF